MTLRPAIALFVRLLPDRDDLRLHAREYLAAALSGLILRLAFPKFDLWPAAWIGMVPLFWSLRGRSGKAAFYRGWTFGTVYFYGVCFFLNTLYVYMGIVIVGIVLLAVISGLYCALFALGAAAIAWRRPVLALAAVPAWWVALESIRSSGELGFPFGALAHSQWQVTSLIQIVSLAGTGAISFLIVLFNLALTRAIFDKATLSPRRRAAELAFAFAAVAACWIYGRQAIGRRTAESSQESALDVLMVQPNIPQPRKWESYQLYGEDHVEKAQAIWDEMLLRVIVPTDDALTSALASNPPDLIVWPETAVPDYFYNLNPRYTEVIERKDRDWKTPLLFGASRVVPAPDGRTIAENYNTAYLYLPDAPANPLYYDKRHLVPFGEDFSYFRYIPIMKIFGLDLGTFDRGAGATVFKIPIRASPSAEAAFSMVICFESTMPYLFRESVRNGAQFMVIVTNDAWYGASSGAAQHQIQSVFRAVETRRWVCRCANTGISCFISPEGRVEQRAGLNTAATLRARIQPLDGQSVYVRLGPWFSWLCLLLSAVSFVGLLRPRAAASLNK